MKKIGSIFAMILAIGIIGFAVADLIHYHNGDISKIGSSEVAAWIQPTIQLVLATFVLFIAIGLFTKNKGVLSIGGIIVLGFSTLMLINTSIEVHHAHTTENIVKLIIPIIAVGGLVGSIFIGKK